MEYNK